MRTAILAGLLPAAISAGGSLAAEAPAAAARTVLLDGRDIALGDIAATKGSAANPAWVLERIPEGRFEIVLSAERREQLVRRRLPALRLPLLHEGPVGFRIEPDLPAARPADESRCYFLDGAVPRGTFLSRANLAEDSCTGGDVRPAVIFDRNAGTLRSTDDLPSGTPLGRLRLPEANIVQPGAPMQLVVREGPVTVSREVETLQPGLPGRPVFVRAPDGKIFTAPLIAPGEGE